jgi:pimeloyl-ACP methyl ester carboxylesterase
MPAVLVALVVLAAAVVVVALLARDGDEPGKDEAEPTATQEPTQTSEPTPSTEAGSLVSRAAFTTGVPENMRAWRIVYDTTDAQGRPDTATATVLAARDLPDGPRPVVGVAHGTVGIASRCAPSLLQQPFTGSVGALVQLVEQGWVAVSTDYAGLGTGGPHPYLVGKAEAHNVLDAVRAAHEVLDLSPKTVLWGHSQGGHASLWAGIEAPTYSPELHVIGVAATAPASDLYRLLTDIRSTLSGTLVDLYLMHAWQQVYPRAGLDEEVQPGVTSVIDQVSRLCLTGTDAARAYVLARSVAGNVVSEGAYDGEFGRLLRANTPTARIEAPVLVAQGLADVTVPPSVQEEWVAERCADGQEIDYREYAGLNHTSLILPASPLMADLVQWAQDRLAGKPAPGNCR